MMVNKDESVLPSSSSSTTTNENKHEKGLQEEEEEEEVEKLVVVVDSDDHNPTITNSTGNCNSSSPTNRHITTMTITTTTSTGMNVYVIILWILLHIITLLVYIIPLYIIKREYNYDEAVLDETHIINVDNKDVNGITTLYTILTNDYWGRSIINYPASHKSWRPFTILMFRYLRGIDISFSNVFKLLGINIKNIHISDLNMHRFVNILTHATAAEMVGIIGMKLIGNIHNYSSTTSTIYTIKSNSNNNYTKYWIYTLSKLCFILHPTHVEVVANAANRSHIVSIVLSLYICDVNVPILLFMLSMIIALLSSETALFHIIPIITTMIAISYVQLYNNNTILQQQQRQQPLSSKKYNGNNIIYQIIYLLLQQPQLIFRSIYLLCIGILYYTIRLYYNTLSIPDGLIRPAENPFYILNGYERIYSYCMVLGIHIYKQFDFDYIGFSHEYGYECIKSITTMYDIRLIPILLIGIAYIIIGCILLFQQRRKKYISKSLLLYIITIVWTTTLFPITGIVKVGTFIADRIVVPSTIPIAILQAYAITSWLHLRINNTNNSSSSNNNKNNNISWNDVVYNSRVRTKLCLLLIVFILAWKRIHMRSIEWMSSVTLLQSSLRTCPRFAKGHLEISKVYSGLYPKLYNLTKARYHLNMAEEIDTKFCDVHYQFALLEAKYNQFLKFEQRLVDALQCGFTMGQAQPIWQQYWTNALNVQHNPPQVVTENKKRYESYMSILTKAIEREHEIAQQQEQEQQLLKQQQKRKSPFVFRWMNK